MLTMARGRYCRCESPPLPFLTFQSTLELDYLAVRFKTMYICCMKTVGIVVLIISILLFVRYRNIRKF